MTSATELLPCPFCGGEAEIHPSNDWDAKFTGSTYFAWCDKCETRGDYYNTEADAIAAWNTRAPVEYEGWFYLPKPKRGFVQYGTPQIEKTENGCKIRQPVEVIESAIRAYSYELDEYIMKRICEVFGSELGSGTCRIVKTPSDSDFSNDWRYRCSECGCNIPVNERDPETGDVINAANYCPNCGAKVIQGVDNAD